MYIRVSATWLEDKERHESLLSLPQTTPIEDLRKMVQEKTGVDPGQQRLFYRGKELCEGHILNDYSVLPNDVILLAKRIIPVEDKQDDEPILTKESQAEEGDKLIPAKSEYYSTGIFKNEEEALEEDFIFKVKRAEHVFPLQYEMDVKFKDIRPASYYIYKISELEPGMTVLTNCNIDSPNELGDWYDLLIEKIGRTRISGTVVMGNGSVENFDVKSNQEFMRIEKADIRREHIPKIHKRKYPYLCKICKDNLEVECKICSCSMCGGKDDWDQILLCDECDKGFHLSCADPPMKTVPDGDWYCSSCRTDTSEIVQPGQKLKITKKKPSMNTKKRNWGTGMACVGVQERNDIVPKNHVGPVPGIEVGTCWKFRAGVASAGVHRPMVAGIHGQSSDCAYSVVLSGGYEDDVDNGNEFYYTGAGGRDLKGNKRTNKQCFDQTLTRTNRALASNCYAKLNSREGATSTDWKKGQPVRVVRSYKLGKHSEYAPKEGFRYDGTYKVVKYFQQRGQSGHMVWRYLLRRDDPAPAPWEEGGQTFDIIYPENYLESQEEKKRMEEEKIKIKGAPKNPQEKRKRTSDSTDSDVTAKKPKYSAYKLNSTALKAINDDTVNKQLWLECQEVAQEGQKKFTDKVKEAFICIICRSLVYDPVTLKCSLNICLRCLKDSLKHCDTEDFHCPHCREILGKAVTFVEKVQEFRNDKLKTALNILFPGYGKA
ncbi:unnamed protein product [Ceutorhynchus assimilis]|uniref:RING-type E3 ubiquitin transferase n=1 Tax=Ceutorhynchus assimilis TaxID=467358 RepID=A0A9P0GQD1_9CUCU|nr:unnamed protein product [Ceutorhynchus assimilis]